MVENFPQEDFMPEEASAPIPVEELEGADDSIISEAELEVPRDDYEPPYSQVHAKERAFYTAALSGPTSVEDMLDTYRRTHTELQTFGTSEDLDFVQDVLDRETDEIGKETIKQLITDQSIPTEIRTQAMREYIDGKPFSVGAAAAFHDKLLDDNTPANKVEASRKTNLLEFLSQREQARGEMAAAENRAAAKGNLGFLSNFADILLVLAPYAEGILARAAKKAAGFTEGENWYDPVMDIIMSGDTLEEYRDAMLKVPYDQRADLVQKTYDALGEIPLGDINRMFAIQDLGIQDYAKWQAYVSNAAGILDTALLGVPVVKSLSRLHRAVKGSTKVHPSSPLATMIAADPKVAARIAAEALSAQGRGANPDLLEALGANAAEIVLNLITPKHNIDAAIVGASPRVIDELRKVDRVLAETAVRTLSSGINSTPAEKIAAQERVWDMLQNVQGGPQLFSAMGVVLKREDLAQAEKHLTQIDTGEMYHVLAPYGKNADTGYETAEEALEAGLKLGTDPREISVLYKDMKTGQLTPLDPSKRVPNKGPKPNPAREKEIEHMLSKEGREAFDKHLFENEGMLAQEVRLALEGELDTLKAAKQAPQISDEFFFARTYTHVYNADDARKYGADAVTSSMWGKGRLGNYVFDIVSRFDEQISSMFLHAKSQATATETELLKSVQKRIQKLKKPQKVNLFRALNDGAEKGEVWTPIQLSVKFGMDTDAEHVAYYTFRRTSDALHSMTNRLYRKTLESEGMVRVVSLDNPTEFYAKPISAEAAKNNRWVYDPKDGAVRLMDQAELDTLYKEGGTLAKLKQAQTTNGESATHILVDNVGSQLKVLPDTPLNYLPGYFQRTYEEAWFVRQLAPKGTRIDGVETTVLSDRYNNGRTVGGYGSEKEAAEAVAKFTAENPGSEFRPGLAKEFNIDQYAEDFKLYSSSIRQTKHRGKALAGSRERLLAAVEDPIDALVRNVRTVAEHTSMDDVVATAEKRWTNTYSHMVEGGAFPKNIEDIQRVLAKDKVEYQNAVALKQLIETVNSVPTFTDKIYQQLMFSTANILESTPLSSLSHGVRVAGKTGSLNPFSVSRKLASQLYIGMNPVRQLLIQPGQLMQWSLIEPAYMASGRMGREIVGMSMAAAVRGTKWEAKGYKAAARAAGMSDEEFTKMTSAFLDKSGVPWAIDANLLIENIHRGAKETTSQSGLQRAAGKATSAYMKVINTGKDLGFTPGEFINLTGSWLIAKRRWIRNNPELAAKWDQKRYADQIGADATKISYAMTQPGSFAYQKGAMATAMQFLAVPHKALLSVTYNKYWSPADKVKILIANAGLFGSYGLGLNYVYETMIAESGMPKPSPDLELLFKGGAVDWALNNTFNWLAGNPEDDQSRINFSQSFSPFAGSPYGPIPWHDFFVKFIDGDWTKAVFGPSYNLVHFHDGRFAKVFRQLSDLTTHPNMSTPATLARGTEIILGLGSGFSNFTKARIMAWHKKIQSSDGKDTGIIPTAVDVAAKLMGFEITEVRALYELTKGLKDHDTELRKYAKDWYTAYVSNGLANGDDQTAMNKGILDLRYLNALWSPDELKQIEGYIISMMKATGNTDKNMLSIITKRIGTTDPMDKVIDKIRASGMSPQFIEFWTNMAQEVKGKTPDGS